MRAILIFIICIMFKAASAQETYISDAFGLIPAGLGMKSRDKWAGYVEYHRLNQEFEIDYIDPSRIDISLVFVGPKSAVAGKDLVHAVSIHLDQYGNMIADGTEVLHTLGQGRKEIEVTQFGIADSLFLPNPISGQYYVGASLPSRQSARADYRVVPNLSDISLRLRSVDSPYKYEAFHIVHVENLLDQYNNPIGEGVGLGLRYSHNDGTHTIAFAPTVHTIAEFRLLTREMATQFIPHLSLGHKTLIGQELEILEPDFISAPILKTHLLEDISAFKLSVGPFMTSNGYLLNDGTPIDVVINFHNAKPSKVTGWISNGYFSTIIAGTEKQLPARVEIIMRRGRFEYQIQSLSNDQERQIEVNE